MGFSFWEVDSFLNDIDVAIIGSGIVGLNAAYSIKRKNKQLKVVILERGILPMGASSKNAGFVCFGSPSELISDLGGHSEEEVFSLFEKRWKGALRLRKILGDEAMDYHNWGGYEVFDTKVGYESCADRLEFLNKNIAKITGHKVPFRNADKKIGTFGFKQVKHMIQSDLEGQIDTGKMLKALIDKVKRLGVEILNGVHIQSWEDHGKGVDLVLADGARISCKKLIITTNGFAKELLPDYPVQPARAQVLITEPIPQLKVKGVFHYDSGYYYFRNIGQRILFGGGRNLDFKTEETSVFGLTQLVQNKLEQLLHQMILPGKQVNIEQRWSGIMGVGPQKKSIVKSVSKNAYCAVRMGGMGVAIGSLVGEEVALLVAEDL